MTLFTLLDLPRSKISDPNKRSGETWEGPFLGVYGSVQERRRSDGDDQTSMNRQWRDEVEREKKDRREWRHTVKSFYLESLVEEGGPPYSLWFIER